MGAEFGLFFGFWLIQMVAYMFMIPISMWWVKRIIFD